MTGTDHTRLFDLLRQLEAARIHFTLDRIREDSVAVLIAVPGERWELEIFSDGSTEVEIFRSDGVSGADDKLAELFRRFSA